jgi:hypothetical protein
VNDEMLAELRSKNLELRTEFSEAEKKISNHKEHEDHKDHKEDFSVDNSLEFFVSIVPLVFFVFFS